MYIGFILTILILICAFFFLKKRKDLSILLDFYDDKIKVKYYGKGSSFDSGKEIIKDSCLFVAYEDNYKLGLKLTFVCFQTSAKSNKEVDPNKNIKDFLTMNIAEKRSFYSWIKDVKKEPENLSFYKIYLDGLFYAILMFDSYDLELQKIKNIYNNSNKKTKKEIISKMYNLIRINKVKFEKVVSLLGIKREDKEYWYLIPHINSFIFEELLSLKIDGFLLNELFHLIEKKYKNYKQYDEEKIFLHYNKKEKYIEKVYSKKQKQKIEKYVEYLKNDIKIFIMKYNKNGFINSYNYLPPYLKDEIDHPQLEEFKDVFSVSKIYNIEKFFFLLGDRYSSEDNLSLRESKLLSQKINDLGYAVIPDPHNYKKNYKKETLTYLVKSKAKYTNQNYGKIFGLISWSLNFSSITKEDLLICLGDIIDKENELFIEKSIDLLIKQNNSKLKDIEPYLKDKLVIDFLSRFKNKIKREELEKIKHYFE